jgi:phosphatidylinositol-3-phosphatase
MRLSPTGVLLLALVSLAATIVILAGGGNKTNAQLAAETALKHPLRAVEQLQSSPAASSSSSSAATPSGGGADISPPASDSSSASSSSGSGSGAAAASSSAATSGGSSDDDSSSSSSDPQTTTTTATTTTTTTATNAGLPKVGHVFLLTLSATSYRDVFAASSQAPYLRSLVKRGTVLSGFHALGRNGLTDLLALVSGQPPNRDTTAGCAKYAPYPQSATLNAAGVAKGTGCVYPDAALTIADQVNAAGKTWGAFVANMGASNCAVPATGESLDTPLDGTEAGYDVAHNPFAFFGSLLDAGGCSEYDQDLTNLPKVLAKKAKTPEFTYLSGDACVDAEPTLAPAAAATTTTSVDTTASTTASATGASTAAATTPTAAATIAAATTTGTTATGATTTGATTTGATTTGPTTTGPTSTSTVPSRLQAPAAYGCSAGETSGIAAEDAFLKTWVPQILASAAYRANGVLVIAFTGAGGKSKAATGALVLSRWTPKHKRIVTSYSAYSLLHSVEDMLALQPLAKAAGAPAFAQLVLH